MQLHDDLCTNINAVDDIDLCKNVHDDLDVDLFMCKLPAITPGFRIG